MKYPPIEKHLIAKDGCLVWDGSITADGHPQFFCPEEKTFKKAVPHWVKNILGMQAWNGKGRVRHTCGNKLCFKEEHLVLGASRPRKTNLGRGKHGLTKCLGETNGNHRLTAEDILVIRSRPQNPKILAAEFEVSEAQIKRILRRENWKHI